MVRDLSDSEEIEEVDEESSEGPARRARGRVARQNARERKVRGVARELARCGDLLAFSRRRMMSGLPAPRLGPAIDPPSSLEPATRFARSQAPQRSLRDRKPVKYNFDAASEESDDDSASE